MNSDTSLPFTEPEVGGSQRQPLEEYRRITGLSNVDFSQFTSTTSEPSYSYGLTTAHSAGSSFTHIPTALGYSNIDPSLLQYDSYNTARTTPLSIAGRESSWDRSDLQSRAPPSNRRIHAVGDLNSDYTAGPSRPMAPPRMGRVASSSSNFDQGYRTNFRAPIPMPTYSANGDYCLSPLFGDQELASESEADHQASTGPVDIVGPFHTEDAGPSRSMAPPRMGSLSVPFSSSNFDQGYTRTNFRAPIPMPTSYSLSANGAYSFSQFGDQAPEAASQYGTLERTNNNSYNQETRPQHPARHGMPLLGHRFPTQAPTHSNHPQMYPPSVGAQATVAGSNYLWDYSQPQKANYQVSDHANVNHPSQHIPPPTPLNVPTSDNSLGAWTFVNTFYPSPARISMKRRRSSLQDGQETAPQWELQENPLRPVKRMRREPPTLGVAAPHASGSGSVYTEFGRLPSSSANAQHHPLRHGTGHHEEPPSPPITHRTCLFDNCGATVHSPSAFAHHLTDAHHLPRSKGRKNAPRYPCLWLGCFDKNGGRREYAGNNIVRHATGHLVARRCELCTEGGKLWYGCRPDLIKHHYLKEHEVRRRADELPPLFFSE